MPDSTKGGAQIRRDSAFKAIQPNTVHEIGAASGIWQSREVIDDISIMIFRCYL